MRPVKDLFPRLLPYLPGCPEPSAAQAVVDGAIAFCEASLAVRYTLDPVRVRAGVSTYDLDAPVDQDVWRVLEVRDGTRYLYAEAADFPRHADGFRGQPLRYRVHMDGEQAILEVFPTPDADTTLTVVAATKPRRDARSLDDALVTSWTEGVVAGALTRLMAIPGQPFTDQAGSLAQAQTAAFLARKARAHAAAGPVRTSQRVQMRPFA